LTAKLLLEEMENDMQERRKCGRKGVVKAATSPGRIGSPDRNLGHTEQQVFRALRGASSHPEPVSTYLLHATDWRPGGRYPADERSPARVKTLEKIVTNAGLAGQEKKWTIRALTEAAEDVGLSEALAYHIARRVADGAEPGQLREEPRGYRGTKPCGGSPGVRG
jgi:hypothetical protein